MRSLITFFQSMTLLSKGVVMSLSTILAALISMKIALLGLCILIFIDLLTGIRKTHHEWEIGFSPHKKLFWKSIKSYLLRQTWKKTYEYGIGIIVISVFEHLIFGTPISIMLMDKSFTLAELSAIIPSIVEIWSIFENFEAVSGNNWLKRLQFLLPARFRSILTGKEVNEYPVIDSDVNDESYE